MPGELDKGAPFRCHQNSSELPWVALTFSVTGWSQVVALPITVITGFGRGWFTMVSTEDHCEQPKDVVTKTWYGPDCPVVRVDVCDELRG